MSRRVNLRLTVCFAFLFSTFIFTTPATSYLGINMYNDSMPGPKLLYPITEDIVLTGKDYLEFRWMRSNMAITDHVVFKLYKGYNTIQDNLIMKQDFPVDAYPIKLPASQFEEEKVYTWVLIEVFRSGKKSDKSFSSFKVIKK
ncbi:MAG: hypothetical protein WC469_05695 [Candidatus Omnitrophota bacterium]